MNMVKGFIKTLKLWKKDIKKFGMIGMMENYCWTLYTMMIQLKHISSNSIASILSLHSTALQYQRGARRKMFENITTAFFKATNKHKAVAISPLTAICPWNLFCRDHSRVFI